MAITVSDVEDLLRVLREHPEWRERVRLEILGEEILSLPERMAGVERQLEHLTSEVQRLAEGQAELRDAVLTMHRSIVALENLTVAIQKDILELRNSHGGRLDNLDGQLYESRFNARSRVGARYRRAEQVHIGDIDEVLDARDDGRLAPADITNLKAADFILLGRDGKGAEAPWVHVVLEVSLTIHDRDVRRAVERASILKSVGLNAVPWVGGKAIGDGTAALARELDVHVELDTPEDVAIAL